MLPVAGRNSWSEMGPMQYFANMPIQYWQYSSSEMPVVKRQALAQLRISIYIYIARSLPLSLSIYIYIHIYNRCIYFLSYIYILYIGGWGDEHNREIVSCRAVRACVRACARSGCLVEIKLKFTCAPFPFSLFSQEAFPFPLWDYSETKASQSECK
jgi:hypothetical protein